MRTIILTAVLACATFLSTQAQTKGDWYIGTGDVANVAWTEWALAPTVGYGVMDNLMVGLSVSQADSTADLALDFHARYFVKGYFVYAAAKDLDTDNLKIGLGKMFTIRNNVFVDPKVVYSTGEKTTNLMLGFGLKF